MFYVYLLQSEKDSSHYIGQTQNINQRLSKHNNGEVISTKNKRPWKLIKLEEYATRNESRWREYQLKHSASKRNNFISGE